MSPLGWVLGFVLPACASAGEARLPPRPDLSRLRRPSAPNNALAGPASFSPPPDNVTPVYPVATERLHAIVRDVAGRQPRTAALEETPPQLSWVQRSALFNFPDMITARPEPAGAGASTLILYSESVYGRYDFGVNHRRLRTWLSAITNALQQPPGK